MLYLIITNVDLNHTSISKKIYIIILMSITPEDIIFNPLIYGAAIFKQNNFGNVDDIDTSNNFVDFQIKTTFNDDMTINNNVIVDDNSKIKFSDSSELNFKELLNVTKINIIENNLSLFLSDFNKFKIDKNNDISSLFDNITNITKNLEEFKTNKNNDINSLFDNIMNITKNLEEFKIEINKLSDNITNVSSNLEQFKTDKNNEINSLFANIAMVAKNLEQFKTNTDDSIEQIKEKQIKYTKLNKDTNLTELNNELYMIENNINITLPIINDKMLGKKITFVNVSDSTSKILTSKNNIFDGNKKNVCMLRNFNTINIIAITTSSWLIF